MYHRDYIDDYLVSFDEYDFSFDQVKQYPEVRSVSDTIVFHPDDPTTDFLSKIYEGKAYDVVNDPFIGNSVVTELIEEHQEL